MCATWSTIWTTYKLKIAYSQLVLYAVSTSVLTELMQAFTCWRAVVLVVYQCTAGQRAGLPRKELVCTRGSQVALGAAAAPPRGARRTRHPQGKWSGTLFGETNYEFVPTRARPWDRSPI